LWTGIIWLRIRFSFAMWVTIDFSRNTLYCGVRDSPTGTLSHYIFSILFYWGLFRGWTETMRCQSVLCLSPRVASLYPIAAYKLFPRTPNCGNSGFVMAPTLKLALCLVWTVDLLWHEMLKCLCW